MCKGENDQPRLQQRNCTRGSAWPHTPTRELRLSPKEGTESKQPGLKSGLAPTESKAMCWPHTELDGQVSLGCALHAKLSLVLAQTTHVTVLTPLPENRPEIYNKELGDSLLDMSVRGGGNIVTRLNEVERSPPPLWVALFPELGSCTVEKGNTRIPHFLPFDCGCNLTFSYLPAMNLWTVSQNTPFLS